MPLASEDMLELASHIVKSKAGHFHPEKFEDHYEDALKELLRKKQRGEKVKAPKEREPAKVVSLMDAYAGVWTQSVELARVGRDVPQLGTHPAKKAARSSARKRAG